MKTPQSKAHDANGADRHPGVPVVGVGSSAGGIEALKTFIAAVKPDSGAAYVIVQHLAPENISALAKILAAVSAIPVVDIEQDVKIEVDHAYVLPPKMMAELADGHLHLVPLAEARLERAPVDHFLLSLAAIDGYGACVILSGTGSDGTLGLRAVKDSGGLTIAQADAEYDGMMRSAVGTGQVDFVLPVAQIPDKLDEYFRHLIAIDRGKGIDRVQQEATDHLAQICALLRTRTGHDFSGYKDKTVARRVQRRMQVLQIEDVPTFINRLRKDPQEVDALLQDLLIGVTNFFRDPAAFDALESKVVARLFDGKTSDDTVRVWVPGCSTGEEAYSIAILLREHMPKGQAAPRVQIFASDIDEDALQIARIGRYPATIARDISPSRLERYFVREDGTYRIASDLRENCLFAPTTCCAMRLSQSST